MAGTRLKVYWDTSVWLGWLLEDFGEAEMVGIQEVVEEVEADQAVIVVNNIFRTEVLSVFDDAGFADRLDRMMLRSNIYEVESTTKISQVAASIRHFYLEEKKAGRGDGIATPDAIHLATAIVYDVDEMHSFDDGGRQKPGMLELSGNVAGHHLRICKPALHQHRLEGF